jgi:hypothetical protein
VPILILTPGVERSGDAGGSDAKANECSRPLVLLHIICPRQLGSGESHKLFECVLPKPSAVIATPVNLEETGVSESSKERGRMLGPSALVGASAPY